MSEARAIATPLAPVSGVLRNPRNRNSAWRKITRDRLSVSGLAILILVGAAAVFAPLISPYDPKTQDVRAIFADPSRAHLLGTDDLGRDILSRIIWGARASLSVGLASVTIAVVCGVTLGLVAGYFGSWVDSVISRVLDIVFSFPTILLALGVVAMLGPSSTNTMIAIGVVYTPVYARLARSMTISTKRREFIEAALVAGSTKPRILIRHIFPNITAPLIIQASLSLSMAILTEASLSFLGLGTQPPDPSWGTMVATGQRLVELSPWQAVFPGFAIVLTVLGFNLVGDGLRDALDPRQRS
jgi:peptide/nickel transport system permease protein